MAVVCHYFPHYRTATLLNLANSTEHEFLFLADTVDPNRAGIKPSPIVDHPKFRKLRAIRLGKFFLQPGLLGWALSKQIDTVLIVAVPHGLTYWIAPILARLSGKRVIFWTIGWIQDDRGPKNWLRMTFYSLANSLLIYGHFGKILGIQRGIPAKRMHVVYNALDYHSQKQFRQRVTPEQISETRIGLFRDSNLPILVCCSRLLPHRQLELAVAALGVLKRRGVHINLLLIGDGPERAKLESLVAQNQIEAHFFGACYDEAILSRLIMSSDLTVAPGMVGLTAMQSLAYGTPVLTHNDPFHQAPESDCLEPGITGQFFEYGNVEDLANKIDDWFACQPDREVVRNSCESIIEKFYNPEYQARVIERAVSGIDADDLFMLKESLVDGDRDPQNEDPLFESMQRQTVND